MRYFNSSTEVSASLAETETFYISPANEKETEYLILERFSRFLSKFKIKFDFTTWGNITTMESQEVHGAVIEAMQIYKKLFGIPIEIWVKTL